MSTGEGKQLRSLCVFCGSSSGSASVYREAAERVGRELARRDVRLVYGGGNVGLMGVLADAVLGAGGRVIGVIPKGLVSRELAHRGLTELHVVETLHERKLRMAALADAFLALPGGLGTMDELFEVLTWAQLGYTAKPCGILDVCGYFRPLLEFLEKMVREGFLASEHRALVRSGGEIGPLLETLELLVAKGSPS
ncbi:MAG: putative cytokinin riboside 5'-monophosphate phosphoribohydrolase [Candidatus Binatia bacterium]|nr:MAG: putative cytokinin riboside 5'-monophosphate phosphoribohydrolase [Candidatus Binatia bacterium]